MQAQAKICPICIDDHGAERLCSYAEMRYRIEDLQASITEARAEIAAKDARIAELEKALVFALRAGAYLTQKGDEIYYDTGPVTGEWKRTVGTDSDLIRVMLAAAKGERTNGD